jgi:hypothetical protein
MRTLDENKLHCRTGRNCVPNDQPLGDCACTCGDCAAANLTEVANWWDEILADRFPGTRRRWHQRRDTAERAEERKLLDAAERAARFGINSRLPAHLKPRVITPPGQSPSPARDDVLDTVAAVTWEVIELRNNVASRFNAGPRKIGVSEACRWIAATVPDITEPAFKRDVARAALDIVRRVRAGTGQIEDVIQLDAACIICGQETLLAYAARMAVTCIGEECVCDLHDCGCHRGEKHIWAEDQLVWLARVLNAEEETA